jgi:hypothetical protein
VITAILLHVVFLALVFVLPAEGPRRARQTVRVTLVRQPAPEGPAAGGREPSADAPRPPRPTAEPIEPPEQAVQTAMRRADALLAQGRPLPQPLAAAADRWTLAEILGTPGILPALQPGAIGPARPTVSPRPALVGSYDARTDARRAEALARFGGTPRTEAAVDLALEWLAAHQEPAGRWDRMNFTRFDPPTAPSGGVPTKGLPCDLDVGVTALATLAFLGRGCDHVRDGEYRLTVHRALGFLLRSQQPGGQFGPRSNLMMYNQAIATLAVAEAFILTGDPRLKNPLWSATAHLLAAQQADGGWDYQPARTGRNDTSITGWAVMALRSARSAGVPIPPEAVLGAMRHFQRAVEENDAVWYADTGFGVREDQDEDGTAVKRYGPAMLAVGLYSRLLLGWDPSSRACRHAAERILDQPADQQRMRSDPTNLHSYYYWYYGTLAMFHMGGDAWKRWNANVQEQILAGQNPAGGSRAGSWQPYDSGWGNWGRYGGRVYVTAINALTLEVYYRHLPLYNTHDVLDASAAMIAAMAVAPTADVKTAIIGHAADLLPAIAKPVLLAGLMDADPSVQLAAGLALADDGDAIAVPALAALHRKVDFKQAAAVARALAAVSDPAAIDLLVEMLDGHWLVAKTADASLRELTDAQVAPSGGIARPISPQTIDAWKAWWRAHNPAH